MSLRTALAASLVLISATAQAAQSGLECVTSTASDYLQQEYRLYQSTPLTLSPSVDYVLAKRRLAETYCLRYAHCFSDDKGSFVFQGTFASCVKSESEKN